MMYRMMYPIWVHLSPGGGNCPWGEGRYSEGGSIEPHGGILPPPQKKGSLDEAPKIQLRIGAPEVNQTPACGHIEKWHFGDHRVAGAKKSSLAVLAMPDKKG